jgi:hypothetical protein
MQKYQDALICTRNVEYEPQPTAMTDRWPKKRPEKSALYIYTECTYYYYMNNGYLCRARIKKL